MYAVPPPPPGYKAPPIALKGAGKGHQAPRMVLDGAGKAAPVMLDGAGKGPKAASAMTFYVYKGAKAPSVPLDGVSTGSSASENSLASTHEEALGSNQKGKGCKGKDMERLPQWVLLRDSPKLEN